MIEIVAIFESKRLAVWPPVASGRQSHRRRLWGCLGSPGETQPAGGFSRRAAIELGSLLLGHPRWCSIKGGVAWKG